MDRKRGSLFKTQILKILEEVKSDIHCKISSFDHKSLKVSIKEDSSIVTDMDVYISDLFKTKLKNLYPNLNFYSEEDLSSFKFPLAILDPIDGTKEFAKGSDQCAISFGVYFSDRLDDERNFSWIYNFFNEFEVHSEQITEASDLRPKEELKGLVSNSEFQCGLYEGLSNVVPLGSIAYKLGLLAGGKCDFVVTKRPKNIWDIAAGTHICSKRGIYFYGQKIESFRISDKLFEPTMLWCLRQNREFINELI